MKKQKHGLLVCIDQDGCPTQLTVGKVYRQDPKERNKSSYYYVNRDDGCRKAGEVYPSLSNSDYLIDEYGGYSKTAFKPFIFKEGQALAKVI